MNEENRPLLSNGSRPRETENSRGDLRFFFSLTLVLMFSKAGEEMSRTSMAQYIYAWCEAYVSNSATVVVGNKTTTDNGTGSCKHHRGSTIIEHKAQVLASQWELYFNIFTTVLLFMSSAILGTLSDYYGRKPFVCLSLFGFAMKTAIFSIVIGLDLHISILFVPHLIDAVCGSSFVFCMFIFIMTADVTNGSKQRVLGITIMEAMVNICRFSTMFGDGYFINATGFLYPMLTATAFIVLSLLLAILILQETLPKHTRNQSSLGPINTPNDNSLQTAIPSISAIFKRYIGFYLGRECQLFWLCFSVYFFMGFGNVGRNETIVLYQLGSPFCWNSELIGWYRGSLMVVCFVIGLAILKPLQLCLPDCISACLGLVSGIAYNILTAFATTTVGLFAGIGVGFFMVLPQSILKGMASSGVSKDRQGTMFAGIQSPDLVCKLVAGPICLAIYAHTLTTMKGGVFLVMGGVNVLALIIMIRLSWLILRPRENI